MPRARRASMIALSLLFGAGACSSTPNQAHDAPLPSVAPAGPGAAVRARLQGTWELVAFSSSTPIPEDATPILTKLRGAVRLRFEADRLTTFVPGKPDEETCDYAIEGEDGDSFTLVTTAGMFRRAKAHFLSTDLWEATENGPTWPGTTQFRRAPP